MNVDYFLMREGVTFPFNKLVQSPSPLPKDVMCQAWLKLIECFLEIILNFKYTLDITYSEL